MDGRVAASHEVEFTSVRPLSGLILHQQSHEPETCALLLLTGGWLDPKVIKMSKTEPLLLNSSYLVR